MGSVGVQSRRPPSRNSRGPRLVPRSDPLKDPLKDPLQSSSGIVQKKQDSSLVCREDERTTAAQNLGEIQALDSSFYNAAGTLLETMLPNQGDKSKLQINLNLKVNPAVKIAFQFVIEGERTDKGLKVGAAIGAGVMTSMETWLVDAFAKAMVFGTLEVHGSSGAEVFQFLSYGLYDAVANVSADAADYVWGKSFAVGTKKRMGKDDYVETGLGAELSAGVSVSSTGEDDPSMGAGGAIRGGVGKRISSGGEEVVPYVGGTLAVGVGPWAGETTFKQTFGPSGPAGELAISATRSANLLEFTNALETGAINQQLLYWVTGLVGTTQGLIADNSGIDGNTAQQLGSVMSLVTSSSLTFDLGANAAVMAAKKRLQKLNAANIGQKLTIKLSWSQGKVSLDVDLERLSTIEYGDNPQDTVYVMVESLERILKLGPFALG